MSNKRLVRERKEYNTREVADLKKEIDELTRQVARLRKENEKLRSEGEVPLAPKPTARHKPKSCPGCGGTKLLTFTAPSGKVIVGCATCRKGNEKAVK
jgi:hypothetical protein